MIEKVFECREGIARKTAYIGEIQVTYPKLQCRRNSHSRRRGNEAMSVDDSTQHV
jgi:hypothetical protein